MSKQPTIFPYRQGRADKFGFKPTYRRVQCSKCPKTTGWIDHTKTGATDNIVAMNLRKRNWFIDQETCLHVCPKCQGRPVVHGPRYTAISTQETEVPDMFFKPKAKPVTVEPTPVEAGAPTPLAPPTPAELRTIRKLLDDVYELEGQRYRKDYSDRTIALIANVPEHWVTIERELAYGPAESPESEAEAQVRMLNELVEQARHHAEEANAALQLVEEKVDALKKKLAS